MRREKKWREKELKVGEEENKKKDIKLKNGVTKSRRELQGLAEVERSRRPEKELGHWGKFRQKQMSKKTI